MSSNNEIHDGYVRIPTSALPKVKLRHFVSEKDLSIAVPEGTVAPAGTITGFTEWVGSRQELTISVGWDWGVVHGVVVLLRPNEIRTNIQLIGEDGRPEPPAIAKIRLLDWIESLPWRGVIDELLTRQT
jgi:hypothetical protein